MKFNMKSSKQYKRIGCLWMASPLIALVVIMIAWAILSFVIAQTLSPPVITTVNGIALSQTSQAQTVIRILNVALGFLGIIAVTLTPFGAVLGLRGFALARQARDAEQGRTFDPSSGQGMVSIVPTEVHKWSWGGFGVGLIWGIYHGVWISLLTLIPFVNFIMMFYLGFKGRELAWKKNKWISPAEFDAFQKKWDVVGIVSFVLSFLPIIASVAGFGGSSR